MASRLKRVEWGLQVRFYHFGEMLAGAGPLDTARVGFENDRLVVEYEVNRACGCDRPIARYGDIADKESKIVVTTVQHLGRIVRKPCLDHVGGFRRTS